MSRQKAILVVDDNQDVLNGARIALRPLGIAIEILTDPGLVQAFVEKTPVDALLLDMNFAPGAVDGSEGLRLLDRLMQFAPDISAVMMTAYGEVTLAVEALKRGAADFVLKPWQNEKLLATMSAAMQLTQAKRAAASEGLRRDSIALASPEHSSAIEFSSSSYREIAARIERSAPTDANILLIGESGTGKEVNARVIHAKSARASRPFIAVDLGAIPESLFESELFGSRRGAFTGSSRDRVGFVESADGGTLFLDEIGNLSLHLQSKLLTVLERRELVPIGTNRPIPIDIRLICATNLSIEELAQPARFRQDLLYRIKTVEIVLPPLRERRADIAPLLDRFLDFYSRKYRVPRKPLSAEAVALLEDYHWPGNIRELRHAAESAAILATGPQLGVDDFPFTKRSGALAADRTTFDLHEIERQAIARALEHFDGNISRAAIALGLTRPALYRRISKHGL